MRGGLTRRQLLVATAAGALAGAGALGVPAVRDRLVGRSWPLPPLPAGPVGELVAGTFRSESRDVETAYRIGYPEGAVTGLPVLLLLHGRGGDAATAFRVHGMGEFLSDAVRRGVRPFAVASVDGGDHSYWHPRRSGEDPQTMVVDELLPVLAERGLRTDRVALGGWSMGGYGALLLAQRLGRGRVASVTVDSAAVWERWEDSAPGAFDDRADFDSHDVLAGASRLAGIPVRVTCGTSDPFLPGARALLRRVPWAERDLGPGGHDEAWWRQVAPAQLAFAGRALARADL